MKETVAKKVSDFDRALNKYKNNHKAESGEFWVGFEEGVTWTQDYERTRGQKRLKRAAETAKQAQQWAKERDEKRRQGKL
jgi:hypothetical protein